MIIMIVFSLPRLPSPERCKGFLEPLHCLSAAAGFYFSCISFRHLPEQYIFTLPPCVKLIEGYAQRFTVYYHGSMLFMHRGKRTEKIPAAVSGNSQDSGQIQGSKGHVIPICLEASQPKQFSILAKSIAAHRMIIKSPFLQERPQGKHLAL